MELSKNILSTKKEKKKKIKLGKKAMTEFKAKMEIRNQWLAGKGSVAIHN